jgi:hypothetical protein
MRPYFADNVKYTGFSPYREKNIATDKPTLEKGEYYSKNAYKDISNYNKRKVHFLEKEDRWKSSYQKEIKEQKPDFGTSDHESVMKSLLQNICSPRGSQDITSEYRDVTCKMKHSLEKYKSSDIIAKQPDLNQRKVHKTHTTRYDSEYLHCFGKNGDVPNSKFFQSCDYTTNSSGLGQSKKRLFQDTFQLNVGSTKASSHVPGYQGFSPVNNLCKSTQNIDKQRAYTNNLKINALETHMKRVPGYQGYVMKNPLNYPGEIRPLCLSTEGETFI